MYKRNQCVQQLSTECVDIYIKIRSMYSTVQYQMWGGMGQMYKYYYCIQQYITELEGRHINAINVHAANN